ncbi:hypothetical protein [Vibrio agarivorans]|uniref:Uncharacterized protein n=1 Tax=Vibrio agarivorans TaxID=153622 RepID=A0ABT7Y7I2_9VIBR|nr:hypothetical protein [Vibrio agarivorans]MDN2484015.1 hypothetical protein [Vibrio agarivorans]
MKVLTCALLSFVATSPISPELGSLVELAAKGELSGNLGINCRTLAIEASTQKVLASYEVEALRKAGEHGLIAHVNDWYIPLSEISLDDSDALKLRYRCEHHVDMVKEGLSEPLMA